MMKYLVPLSALFLVSCATVSTSNSPRQILDATRPIPQSAATVASGIRTFEMYKRTKPRVANTQVQRVGNRIKNVVPLTNAQWEFVTFKNSTPNAFALPGGKVGVHDGFLPITQTDAGLATILSHEIAHVTLNHHEQARRNSGLVGLGGALLGSALGSQYSGLINTTSELAFNLPNSRKNETEADRVGLIYMARAGYDPREAIKFWERFNAYNKQHGRQLSAFLSTHPLNETRINTLKQTLPIAMVEYQKTL